MQGTKITTLLNNTQTPKPDRLPLTSRLRYGLDLFSLNFFHVPIGCVPPSSADVARRSGIGLDWISKIPDPRKCPLLDGFWSVSGVGGGWGEILTHSLIWAIHIGIWGPKEYGFLSGFGLKKGTVFTIFGLKEDTFFTLSWYWVSCLHRQICSPSQMFTQMLSCGDMLETVYEF